MTGPLLSGVRIRELLAELGRRLAARGVTADLFRVGGAAMALAYNRERATRDLDAVFEPKQVVYAEARRIADDLGLPPDWLNDAVKGLLPDRRPPERGVVVEFAGLSVAVATPEYLFAMKTLAARADGDAADVLILARLLRITEAAQAYDIVDRYCGRARVSVKTGLLIESLFGPGGGASAGPA